MGKQIQIDLTTDDECRLIEYLSGKFPIIVVNRLYPNDWDHRTLVQSPDVSNWLIIDTRVIDILISSAEQINNAGNEHHGKWQIRSKAYSCIEWSRDLRYTRAIPGRGRLYVNTNPDMIWQYVSAEIGDDVEKGYKSACRWLRKNCVNTSEYSYGVWTSRAKITD